MIIYTAINLLFFVSEMVLIEMRQLFRSSMFISLVQSTGAVEYTDCISAEG